MYGRAFSAIQVINIVIHSIFTLLCQIGLSVLIGWLLTERWGAPQWVFVPVILLGVGSGLVSMVRFVISASAGVERIEREREEKYRRLKSQNQDKNNKNGDNNER